VTVEVGGACSALQDVETTGEDDAGAPDASFDYSLGLVGFRLPCASASVKLYFHGTPFLTQPYRKYGPTTPGSPGTTTWYTLDTAGFGSELIGGQTVATVTLPLSDGALGDDTGVDGEIVDPGGPAQTPVQVPALGPAGVLALSALLMGAGAVARRGRRRLSS